MFSLQLAAVYVADEHIAWGMRDQKVRFSLSGYVLGCDTAGPKDWNLVRTDIQPVSYTHLDVYKRQDLAHKNWNEGGLCPPSFSFQG